MLDANLDGAENAGHQPQFGGQHPLTRWAGDHRRCDVGDDILGHATPTSIRPVSPVVGRYLESKRPMAMAVSSQSDLRIRPMIVVRFDALVICRPLKITTNAESSWIRTLIHNASLAREARMPRGSLSHQRR